ncbi:MAG: NADH-quinone oxidoreductase subunit C [Dehalococcoidia bacterium]|nr:NADH-quinone oxidoreductase subunit C [Dehalococcoidia bacterium]
MTTTIDYKDLAVRLQEQFGEGFTASTDCLEVPPNLVAKAAEYIKNMLDFNYFDMVTAADYPDRFELIYRLQSLSHNVLATFKVICSRENPSVPSLANLWLGASLQEREIYDLFGIEFSGHPNLKRIVLWDDFEGYPLRKDFKGKVYGTAN